MDEPLVPLDPFPTPEFISISAPDLSTILPVIFAVVFFLWLLYTLTITYHWFRYSHRSFFIIPALAVHVVVSGTLMLLATTGLR